MQCLQSGVGYIWGFIRRCHPRHAVFVWAIWADQIRNFGDILLKLKNLLDCFAGEKAYRCWPQQK
jgi:hypothetical protein